MAVRTMCLGRPRWVLASLAAVVMTAGRADGSTKAHWRFEGDAFSEFFADVSGSSHALTRGIVTNTGTLNSASLGQTIIPGSGPGSRFPTSILQTLQNNSSAAAIAIRDVSNPVGDGYFTVPDSPDYIALAFDNASANGTPDGVARFYAQNLTDNGPLQFADVVVNRSTVPRRGDHA